MMFKRNGGGGVKGLLNNLKKKLHLSYVSASLREIYETNSMHTISAKKWPTIRRKCLSKSPRVSTMDSVGPLEHLLQILWRRKTEQRKKMQEEEQLCRPSHRFKLENSERALGMFRQVSGD